MGPLEGIDVLRFIFSAMGVTFCVVGGLLAIRHQQSRELRDARRVMAERRRIQRERERLEGQQSVDVDARYQQIVQSFLFQNVNSNKTNISADSIRGGRGDGEAPPNPEEEEESPNRSESFKKLSSWRKPKDECCICLEHYSPGETICVPVTKECNHVFHEECIVEWLKNHTECPLCRIQILGGD